MAAFNLLSIVFVVVLILIRQGQVGLGMFVALSEVILHQILAVHFTGWTPGFQFYLPVVGALPLMLPRVPTAQRIVFASVPVFAFVALTFLHDPSPPNPFPESVGRVLGHINLLIALSVPWVFVYYFRRGAELAEADLARTALRAEKLLHGILPPSVVGRLREGGVRDGGRAARTLRGHPTGQGRDQGQGRHGDLLARGRTQVSQDQDPEARLNAAWCHLRQARIVAHGQRKKRGGLVSAPLTPRPTAQLANRCCARL